MTLTDNQRRTKLVDKLRQEMIAEHKVHADSSSLRLLNERHILNYIRRVGSASRSEIVLATGLTRSAVGSIILSLREQYFLEGENEPDESPKHLTGGRPASEVRFRADAGYIIGVDIGRSHLTIIITDLEARGIDETSPSRLAQDMEESTEVKNSYPWVFTDDTFRAEKGAEECLIQIADDLRALVQENNIDWNHIVGIGIGLPGTHDKHGTRLVRANTMAGWTDVDVPDTLRMLLRLKGQKKIPIYLDNDANLGALGESRYGVGQGRMNMVFVKLGTGIGAGLVLGGNLYHGSGNTAGEFGHQIMDIRINNGKDVNAKSLPSCGWCGNKGCLEALAAEKAIVRYAGLYATSTEKRPRIEDVISQGSNNERCRIALVQAGEYIGTAVANLISFLNPELVVLGGHIIHKARDCEEFMKTLRKQADLCVPAARGTEIEIGSLYYAVAYGAVARVIDEAFRSPMLSDIRQV